LRRRFWLLPVRDLLSFSSGQASFGMNQIEWRGSRSTWKSAAWFVTPRSGRG